MKYNTFYEYQFVVLLALKAKGQMILNAPRISDFAMLNLFQRIQLRLSVPLKKKKVLKRSTLHYFK